MIDDVRADFGKAIDVGLSGAKIAALDGVIKEAPDTVVVVLVVFGSIDATLSGDAVGTPGAILEAETFDIVAPPKLIFGAEFMLNEFESNKRLEGLENKSMFWFC